VPAGVTIERPIVVVDWLDEDGAATFPRLSIRIGADSDVTVIEWRGSGRRADAFAAPITELDVGPAARFRHVVVQDRGERVFEVATQITRVAQEATFHGYQAGLGGDYARSRVDCRLTGRGATGNLSAVYFGEGDQMLDFRTFQDHQSPDTSSNLLFKGAVGGKSRSVYTGLIKVEKDARGTNAFQTNRNLKLSEHAWAESIPNLEIENNDVHCSHASTVGPVDEEQRFYLESRGVPTSVAERLIVAGFFEEVLADLPVAGVAGELRRLIQDRLDQEGI
jgi:Fe-S cluster assembly protein SufD